MNISHNTKYFLLVLIFNLTLNPQRALASNLIKCGRLFKPTDYEVLIGPVCSENYSKFVTCVEKNLNKSTFPTDKRYLNSNDFTNIEKKTSKFCQKFKKLAFKPDDCDTSLITTVASSKFCMNDHGRLEYTLLEKCSTIVRMSWFAYRDSTYRHGCLIIDPWYQIIPRYGPEVTCYRDFMNSHSETRTDNTSLIDVSATFCRQFDYDELIGCINNTTGQLNPKEFGGLEKKKKYECAAKTFAEKRREFCERFNQVVRMPHKLGEAKMLKCKKMVAESRTASLETLVTKYLKCLHLDTAVADLFHKNLMASKDIDRCRENSSYFEYLISKNSAGFRYSRREHLLIFVTLALTFMG